jgi:hypothetical protein
MAEVVGDVAVRVGGDITQLNQSMKDGAASVSAFSSRAGSSLRGFTNDLAKVAAGAAAAGAAIVSGLVINGMKTIDAQAKLAKSLDGTIGGLRALEMAAGDAGVSEEELAGAVTLLNAKLGQAQTGIGGAAQALKTLGINATELSGLDIDQKMALIADRTKELGLNSSGTAALMRDLGIKNENLANLMRQGGDAIRAQSDEVKNLGLNLSMVDAAQVEAANDALGIFGDVMTGIQDRLTVTVAPYITVLSEGFRSAALESNGFKTQTEIAIESVVRGLGIVGDVTRGVQVSFKGLEVVMAGFNAAALTAFEGILHAATQMFDGILYIGNKVIANINDQWGTSLDFADYVSDSAFMDGIHRLGDESRTILSATRNEMHELAMQEMPSDKIDRYLADVAAKSSAAAKEVVAARNEIMGNSGSLENEAEIKSSEEEQKKIDAELEAIKNRYITEEELLRQHREMMAIIGEEYDASKFETEAQWRSITEQAEAEHLQKMQDLNRNAYEGIQNLISSKWGNAAASTAGAFKSILGTMAVQSKKAFEISKAWALADALISTFQGIAKGVAMGWPAGIPAVAWAAATGYAQVSAIRSQSFGGAGGAAASGNGTPATAPNPVGVGGSTSGQQETRVMRVENVNPNSLFTGSSIRGLVEAIDNFRGDGGGKVVFA